MQQYYTFDQLVEQLPEICKEQRRFLQLTQADVVERLEKETGVRKDQSKISMFESGKIAIPDFYLITVPYLIFVFQLLPIERSI